jgi:ring-1,2-phenylacetyl-CoA epoxidase subunit PaaC
VTDAWSEDAVDLVAAIHDTKLVLSQRLFEWSLGGPTLEDDAGAVSMGSDELGHARQLGRTLQKAGVDEERVALDRPPAAWASASPLDTAVDDWERFQVTAGLVDRAAWYLLDAVQLEDLSGLLRKMGEDEFFHLEYHDARLGAHGARDPDLVADVLEETLPGVLALLGPVRDRDPLVEAGVVDRSASELREAYRADLEEALEGDDVEVPPFEGPDPGAWDPTRRRVDEGGPEEELLRTIRGERNRDYALR